MNYSGTYKKCSYKNNLQKFYNKFHNFKPIFFIFWYTNFFLQQIGQVPLPPYFTEIVYGTHTVKLASLASACYARSCFLSFEFCKNPLLVTIKHNVSLNMSE